MVSIATEIGKGVREVGGGADMLWKLVWDFYNCHWKSVVYLDHVS